MEAVNNVDLSFYLTPQGKDLISSLRQPLGILEKPLAIQDTNYDVADYKLLLYGKSGVGKTSLISKILNCPISPNYYETPGIEISTIYWPIKVMNNGVVIIFKLNFWDVGDNALLRHKDFVNTCRENLDGIVYVFSFTDKSSFNEVTKKVLDESGVCKFIVGCKLDSMDTEVTINEVREFEEFWRNKILPSPPHVQNQSIDDVANILNSICFQLLKLNKKPLSTQSRKSKK